ncbi:hypothetical protein ACKC9G_05025 [Pokkaliibacter sp. CJK22405]|uniref:hypothetical protein n=1 Tax=Pokkaliibacter sp. CJK22405 TaxID=3384615 RepID=UPI003984A68E
MVIPAAARARASGSDPNNVGVYPAPTATKDSTNASVVDVIKAPLPVAKSPVDAKVIPAPAERKTQPAGSWEVEVITAPQARKLSAPVEARVITAPQVKVAPGSVMPEDVDVIAAPAKVKTATPDATIISAPVAKKPAEDFPDPTIIPAP